MGRTVLAFLLLTAATPLSAGWSYQIVEDPMTDARRGISSVLGDEGILVVKCDRNGKNSLYVSVISTKYLGGLSSNTFRDLKFRVDGGNVQSIRAFYKKRAASVFDLKPGAVGGAFLEQILSSNKLVIQVTNYDYEAYTITFDTTGAKGAIQKAAIDCQDTNWIEAPSLPAGE